MCQSGLCLDVLGALIDLQSGEYCVSDKQHRQRVCFTRRGELTKLGRRMAEFPLDPMLAKTLIASETYKVRLRLRWPVMGLFIADGASLPMAGL
jgi:hypothetical protein